MWNSTSFLDIDIHLRLTKTIHPQDLRKRSSMKINQVMTKTVLEMLKTASDIEIREISIFADNEERNRAIKDISDDIKTNKKTNLIHITAKR